MKYKFRFVLFLCLFCATTALSAFELPENSISFQYAGEPAELASWKTTKKTVASTDSFDAWQRTYVSPDGRLQIELDGKTYKKFPVTEYSVSLANLSRDTTTDIVADFRSLDLSVPISGNAGKKIRLNTLRGSTCTEQDFSPLSVELSPDRNHVFETPGGRSSNECMPFIELDLGDDSGMLFAVGWTGGWNARFDRGSGKVRVQLGMRATRFKLTAGESIRQPSVTVFRREGKSRLEFKTLVHRFMLEHKVPRGPEGKIIPPILAVACGGGNKTPKMMLDILRYVVENKFPFDTYWIDAGWYGPPHEAEPYSNCGPSWWKYVGDWRVNTTTHPTGDLLPIAGAVHEQKLKLLLWFEPERVAEGMPVMREHPGYLHGALLDMGNPEANRWIRTQVFKMIEKHGIDIYRQDFNMDPGATWDRLDKENPERVGIAEAKHIRGMYEYLDEMRRRFPKILLENCASGGRRLDIEMLTRAHAYCRSDYFIGQKPEDKAFILGQNATLNTIPYLPFQGCEFNCVPIKDDYAAMSIISSGTVLTFSDFDGGVVRREFSDEETRWFKKVMDIAARMKEYYTGGFYPLCEETPATNDVWCGWQLDRSDLNSGFSLIFRRGNAPEAAKVFTLGNIDTGADYELEFFDGTRKTVKGAELKTLKVELPPRSFQLVFYTKK